MEFLCQLGLSVYQGTPQNTCDTLFVRGMHSKVPFITFNAIFYYMPISTPPTKTL
jgi:hypothetical protein